MSPSVQEVLCMYICDTNWYKNLEHKNRMFLFISLRKLYRNVILFA